MRLIDADALLTAFPVDDEPTLTKSCVRMTIKHMPTIEPEQQRWIPCSKQLPDADDCPMDCMVTRKSKFMGNYVDVAVCERNGTWTHEDWDAIVLGDVESGKKTGLVSTRDDDIIAWMPLPEPWKGEQPC